MKPHRIKHIPTGLYYKPGRNNLSKVGYLYETKCDVLSFDKEYISLYMSAGNRIVTAHKELFSDWKPMTATEIVKRYPITDFVREEVNL